MARKIPRRGASECGHPGDYRCTSPSLPSCTHPTAHVLLQLATPPDEVGISAEAEDTPAPSATVEHSETTATADTELPDKLDELARLVFEKKYFDYQYDADPPGMKEGGEVRRFAKMCSLGDPDEAHAYIRDVIMT